MKHPSPATLNWGSSCFENFIPTYTPTGLCSDLSIGLITVTPLGLHDVDISTL